MYAVIFMFHCYFQHCGEMQLYKSEKCRCACKNDHLKKPCRNDQKKLWDANECKCKCKNIIPCSTGLTFDEDTCKLVYQYVCNSKK